MNTPPEICIDICICTFRRPGLAQTLQSIAEQGEFQVRVVVADNDETPSAEDLVRREAHRLNLRCHYLHAPARNISVARNACLDAAHAPLVAFLDDDEIAVRGWLSALVTRLNQGDADVVFGPVQAVYDPTAPAWLREGDFHSTRVVVLPDHSVQTGYAGNCLMRAEVIGDERFDLSLGVSGGEDTEFFFRLCRKGARLVEAPEAIAYEPVSKAREKFTWLLKRSFRSGQTHARILLSSGAKRLPSAVLTAAKFAYCVAAAAFFAWRPLLARRSLIRGALHAGATARLLGAQDVSIYGRAAD